MQKQQSALTSKSGNPGRCKNMIMNKKALSTMLVIAACGFTGAASAHTYAGTISSTAANAHDLIQTTCFSWGTSPYGTMTVGEFAGPAAHLVASLGGTGSTGLTIQALPGGAAVNNSAASVSVATQLAGSTSQNGAYYVKINRALAGAAVSYTATLHCSKGTTMSANHTGTGEGFAGDVGSVLPSVDYIELINQ
jgi:hypothetical protein